MHSSRPAISILSAIAGGACLFTPLVHAAPPAKNPAPEAEQRQVSNPGPWGELQSSPIYLEAPDHLLASVPKPNSVPRWCFPGADGASLRALFTRAGLPAAMQQRLLDPQRWSADAGVITLFPLIADLEALTPEMRATVYAELAKSPLNEFHHDPIFIIGGLDAWLRDTALPADIQALIRKMTYRRGRALAFSDLRTLLSHARTEADVQSIFKSATRIRTLVVSIRIPADADPQQMASYWTGGRADSDILPLVKSLTELPFESTIDITHLLPALARRRLYTYPTPDLATRGRMPDCHWTSLNFFSRSPQDYYLDTRLASRRVIENYASVPAPYRFGDVLFFNNTAGETIHSCAFIADDIVYTKNGENSLSPWILMRMADVQDIYLSSPGSSMQGYREKVAQAR